MIFLLFFADGASAKGRLRVLLAHRAVAPEGQVGALGASIPRGAAPATAVKATAVRPVCLTPGLATANSQEAEEDGEGTGTMVNGW